MTEPEQSPEQKPRDKRVFNAYRHGLTGHVLIITPADEQPYKDHCQGIHQYFAPVGGMEIDLIQQIADDRWRMKNAAAWEAAIIARGLNRPDDALSGNEQVDTHPRRGARLGRQAQGDGPPLSLRKPHPAARRKKRGSLQPTQADPPHRLPDAAEEARLLSELAKSKGESYEIERDFPLEFLPPQFDFSSPRFTRLAAHHSRLVEARNLFPPPPKPLRRAA